MTAPAPSRHLSPRLSDLLPLAAIAALALATGSYSLPLMDDVYITLQHGVNLTQGAGLVYQEGDRVLGSTSPLHALLLAAFVPIFGEAVLPAVSLWVVCLVLAAFLLYRLLDNPLLGAAAVLALVTDPSLSYITGMETTLFVCVCFLSLWLYRGGAGRAAFAVAGTALLVRPDAVFLIASLALVDLLESRTIDRWKVALLALPGLLWSAFAWPYYGNPVPMSFFAKYYQGQSPYWGVDTPWFLVRIGSDLAELRYGWTVVGLLAALYVGLRRGAPPVLRASLAFLVLYAAAYGVTTVPSYENYYFPFWAFVYLSIGMALAAGVRRWLARRRSEGGFKLPPRPAADLAAGLAIALAAVLLYRPASLLNGPKQVDEQDVYLQVSRFLRQNTPDDAVVGIAEIGIVGFHSERRIADFAGLVTPGVARALARRDTRYVLDTVAPDFIVVRYPTPWEIEGVTTE